jgi:phosphoribosylformylglycinamidine cyclo-ligase
LPQLIEPAELELAGSAVGIVPQGRGPILGEGLEVEDEIVLVQSAGLHANGASLARMVAGQLERGYETPLPSGRSFGEALLDRSVMYVALVRALLAAGVEVHYLSHITGHGLLKLMRPARELAYRITRLPPVPEVLDFLVHEAGLTSAAAYSTFNMGAGFAVYCAPGAGTRVVELAGACGLEAWVSGAVEPGARQVVLEPVEVTFASDQLDLAPARKPSSEAR